MHTSVPDTIVSESVSGFKVLIFCQLPEILIEADPESWDSRSINDIFQIPNIQSITIIFFK
jgi:hypothetical protein